MIWGSRLLGLRWLWFLLNALLAKMFLPRFFMANTWEVLAAGTAAEPAADCRGLDVGTEVESWLAGGCGGDWGGLDAASENAALLPVRSVGD